MSNPFASNAPKSPVNAPFPSPLPAGRSNAPSIISSRLTDIDSEDGDDLKNKAGPGLRPETASTDAHRPGSALSSRLRPQMSPATSRRPLGSPGSLNTLRAGGTQGLGGSVVTDPSRPGSSTSRTSRTHIPSLASQAFFRPMSSQRLQAQRSARPSRGKASVSKSSAPNTASSTRRNSFTSNPTEFPITASRDPDMPPPPTRGTNYTEPEDRATNTSPDGKFTFRSFGGSERPLQQSLSSTVDGRGNHHTTSSEDSPSFVKAPAPLTPAPGINYQYFSGNTFFCWGGRLQNTRGRPINLASGLFVFVPSILFLAFS